jgi:hypothetical protein
MTSEMQLAMREEGLAQGQGTNAYELGVLLQHRQEAVLRLSDLRVQIAQLQKQQDLAAPSEKVRLNRQIAELKDQETVARVDYHATNARIASIEKAAQAPVATTIQRPRMPVITRQEVEKAGIGAFLLMFPLVLALARRIWVRGGPRMQPTIDLESSPRLQRLEEAVEAIAVEVERIGEGQRFATKLLSERLADPQPKRATPAESSSARRIPGTITPH